MVPEPDPTIYIGKTLILRYPQEVPQKVRIKSIEVAPAMPIWGTFDWLDKQQAWFIAEYTE